MLQAALVLQAALMLQAAMVRRSLLKAIVLKAIVVDTAMGKPALTYLEEAAKSLLIACSVKALVRKKLQAWTQLEVLPSARLANTNLE